MVFNITFNNIAGMLWQSVLLVEETGVPRENLPVASHCQTGQIAPEYKNKALTTSKTNISH